MAFQAYWQDLVVQYFPKQTDNWRLQKDIVIIALDDEIQNIDKSVCQAQVFPAVDFRNVKSTEEDIVSNFLSISAKYDINLFRYGPPGLSSVKQVGCSLSHIILWMHISQSSRPFVTVLESDAKLVRPIVKVTDGVDIVFQGYSKCEKPNRDCIGAWGYSITPKYARYLLEQSLPINIHMDRYLFMTSGDKNVIMANPKTVVPNGRDSTLDHVASAYSKLCKKIKKLVDEPKHGNMVFSIVLSTVFIVILISITCIVYLRCKK